MRRNWKQFGMVFLLAVFALSPVVVAAEAKKKTKSTAKWMTSYKKALKEAKDKDKPILINFTGSDWCGWCIKLKAEVFSKKEFKTWAAKNVILLEIDFPKRKSQTAKQKKTNRALAAKFKVAGYPTIVIVDENEKELGRSGYLKGGAKAWVKNAQTIIDSKTKKTTTAK